MLTPFRRLRLLTLLMLVQPTLLLAQETGKITGTVSFNTPTANTLPAVVYLVGMVEAAPKEPALMTQKARKYFPEVLAITKGQQVVFTNKDKVVHNVFSMSEAKQFDLGEAKSGASSTVDFTRTGIIDIYCNIHSMMVANILVLPNQKFAYTDDKGRYQIDGIPAGKYQLFAWHRMASPFKKEINITSGQTLEIALTLALDKEPTPHLNKLGKTYKHTRRNNNEDEYDLPD